MVLEHVAGFTLALVSALSVDADLRAHASLLTLVDILAHLFFLMQLEAGVAHALRGVALHAMLAVGIVCTVYLLTGVTICNRKS